MTVVSAAIRPYQYSVQFSAVCSHTHVGYILLCRAAQRRLSLPVISKTPCEPSNNIQRAILHVLLYNVRCDVTDRVAWSVGLSHYVKYALQSFLTDPQQLDCQLSTWPLSFCAYNAIHRNNSLCVNDRASTVPLCAEVNAFVTNYC